MHGVSVKSFMRQRENGISLSLLRCSSNVMRDFQPEIVERRSGLPISTVYVVVKMKLRLVLIRQTTGNNPMKLTCFPFLHRLYLIKYMMFMVSNGYETLPNARTTLKRAPEHNT